MGKKSFAIMIASLSLVACGGRDADVASAYAEDGSVARASIVSAGCGSQATLIELPAHCAWPLAAHRRTVLATSANVVVDVDAEGRPGGARVVDSAGDEELDAALVGCAMRGKYRPAWNGAGATCPTTVRLARYPMDLAPRVTEAPRACGGGVMYDARGGVAADDGPCQAWTPFR